MLAVDPSLFPHIEGSTDSELLFHLALTEGLEDEPLAALERAVGFVESTAARHGVEKAIQASIGVSDGESLWAVRYSTEHNSRTLFSSSEVDVDQGAAPREPAAALGSGTAITSWSPSRSPTFPACGTRSPSRLR